QLRGLGCRDELHVGEALQETEVLLEALISHFALLGRLGRRCSPLFARRVGAVAEVDPVPELLMHELTRMIKDANYAAAFRQQLVPGIEESLLRLLEIIRATEPRPELVGKLVEIQH